METKEKEIIYEPENYVQKENIKKIKFEFQIAKLKSKAISILFIILVLLITVVLVINNNSGVQLTTISKSSLQNVIEINEFSTVDYTYNATVAKCDKNNDVMYYVAYEGIVTAGIDFNELKFDVIDAEKKVIITVPNVEIHNTKVDMGTMEYIFTKNKYETEDISHEAYKLCKEDLKARIEKENVLYDTAKENAISSVEALFKPWIETIDNSYEVEIK